MIVSVIPILGMIAILAVVTRLRIVTMIKVALGNTVLATGRDSNGVDD
jgi:hypothetical protein